jgi:hypothetical protein
MSSEKDTLVLAKSLFIRMETDRAQAAALIAIAERLEVQNEHLEYIRNHLDDIGTALVGAVGRTGGICVDVLEG